MFKLSLVLILVVNQNGKGKIVASALTECEDTESFVWIFENFKKATGASPKVFLTDGIIIIMIVMKKE